MQKSREKDGYTRLAEVICWIGILGLIMVVSRGAWAEPKPLAKLPAGMPVPTAGAKLKSPAVSAKGAFDDIDDDGDYDDEAFAPPQGSASAPGAVRGGQAKTPPTFNNSSQSARPRTFSAGGSPNLGNNPVQTSQGISVGGTTANGVVSTNRVPLVKIDAETAEGSNDIVTDFNFPDADILDIAKTLGKLTGKNFILDKDVKGKITIISNSSITVSDAWKAFLTALDMNGFAMIPSGRYIRIARQRDARDKQLKTYTGETSPDTDALITRVFQLKYISAEEVARTFRSFVPANARIIPYEQTNTVIVTDTGTNISKLSKMLEILDVEGYDAGIEVIPVKYASATELSKLIDALIPGTSRGTGAGGAGGAPRFGSGGLGKFNARRTKEGGIINTVISDERTNTLIVHANTRGADQVRELVAKLDQKLPSSSGGNKVHVIYLQFADAEQIASTLNNFSQASTAPKPAGAGGTGTGVNPNESTLFQGSIKISPDKNTNSLVITSSPNDYLTVKKVVDRLDIPRDQIYVEVVIMEENLGRGFNQGSNLFFNKGPSSFTSPNDVQSLFTQGPFGSKGAILPFFSGGTSQITIGTQPFDVPNVAALVKVIQTHSNTNLIATPQIIALDNAEANFESAEKLPTLQTTVQGTAAAISSVNYIPVALSIKIKPQINKLANFVKMDITLKHGDVSSRELPKGVQDLAYPTTDRTVQTTVVVGDSDTVVLGGLIKDKVTDSVSKIPLLGDIPILGWLFKSKTTETVKSNLLVFLTPHIVRQYEKVRAILDRKLRERDEFIEANTGAEDPLKNRRDDIIRSLPDIKDIVEKKPARSFLIDEDTIPEAAPGTQPATLVGPPRSSNTVQQPPATPPQQGLAPTPEQGMIDPTQPPMVQQDSITPNPGWGGEVHPFTPPLEQ